MIPRKSSKIIPEITPKYLCLQYKIKSIFHLQTGRSLGTLRRRKSSKFCTQPVSIEVSGDNRSMSVPVSQMWTVASYVIRQKLAGRKRYPLVLMLEPLFRCNLACAGCGKIQYPAHVLKTDLSPEDCFKAVDECGAPMVSIPGGEPLMHPQIAEIVEGLV